MTPQTRGRVLVFAKPPRAGAVKTRLAPAVGAEGAARLARAFLADTWSLVRTIPWARPVLALDGEADALVPGAEVWPQGDGDLGERIERLLARALEKAPWAIAVGTDSPALPRAFLFQAWVALQQADAVLGPTADGGFYLIGLRQCPPGLLAGLPWSTADTYARTAARLWERGLDPTELAPWFDVDRPADLERLRALLSRPRWRRAAPETARVLACE